MGYADAVGRINALGEEQDILFRRLNQGYKSVARSTRFGLVGTTATSEWLMKQRLVRYAGQSSNTYSKYAINTIGSVSASSMADITAQVIAGTVGAVNQEFVIFAQAIKHSANRKAGLSKAHALVAAEAREKVIDKYESSPFKRAGSYREGDRKSGMMKMALRAPDFAIFTSTGIIFGNTALLDNVAPHWRRLNYGAGTRGGSTGANSIIPLRISGETIGNFTIDSSPSPGFIIPKGVFLQGGSSPQGPSNSRRGFDQFYLATPSVKKTIKDQGLNPSKFIFGKNLSKGIKGYNFFEPGLIHIGNTLPTLYQKILRQWIDEAVDEMRPRGPVLAAGYGVV